MRRTWIIGLVLMGIAAAATFRIANEVRALETELRQLNRAIIAEQESLRILNAEWAYLNDPARIQRLTEHYLLLGPTAPAQMAALSAVPEKIPVAELPPLPVPNRKPTFGGQGVLLAKFADGETQP